MQEYWENYLKSIDGHEAIVSFNAGISDGVPHQEFRYVGFVKIILKNKTKDGLITKDESSDISFIEDQIEMESLRWRTGQYIGRIISNNEVNFIYYLKLDFEWSNTVFSAMKKFDDYKYEYGSRIDTEWDVYKKLLFPTVKEWQSIVNQHACDNLKKQGDNLDIPRAIEHKVYFTSKEKRMNFIKTIKLKDFLIQKESETPFKNRIMYGVSFYKIDKCLYPIINKRTLDIINICNQYDGQYDGWECSLTKRLIEIKD